MSEWETFCDLCYYYDLWRVRRKNDRGIYDGYHLQDAEEARALVELLNGLERERDEAKDIITDIWIAATSNHRFILPASIKHLPQYIESIIKSKAEWTPKNIKELERERDEARGRVKELIHENENLYRRLESVHEVYRLSSVCRELKEENDKLKTQLEERELYIERVITWPNDADPFTSPDHDNDRHYP